MRVFGFLFRKHQVQRTSNPPSAPPTRGAKNEPAFAVIDVETTGLSPKSDRIVELAIVRVDRGGNVVEEFLQRFNPEGPVGATHIHGIRDVDVANMPFFHQVASTIVDLIRGLPVVAHNAKFDLAFLRAELVGAGWSVPLLPSYCTLDGSHDYLPDASRRRLVDCCWATGITLNDAHSALGDARATSELLRSYLSHGGPARAHLARASAEASGATWSTAPHRPPLTRTERMEASGRPRPIRISPTRPKTPALLRQLSSLSLAEVVDEGAPAGTMAYVELLFDALEDGDIDEAEASALRDIQQAYQLLPSDIEAAHQSFLLALAHKAVDDGHVSTDERRELNHIAQLLSVHASKVKAVTDHADASRLARLGAGLEPLPENWTLGEPLRVGDRIAFTGCDEAQRARLEQEAERLGVRVMSTVTKLTVALVADGSFSGGKMAKAAQFSTRIVHPNDLGTLLKHLQPTRLLATTVVGPATLTPGIRPDFSVDKPSPAVVRAWAVANGIEVGVRGRIHGSVFEAYAKANVSI